MKTRVLGFFLVLVPVLGLGGYLLMDYLDRHHAAEVFGFMAHDGVLASRRWHSEVFGCTYAVVSLGDAAPVAPPSQWIETSLWHRSPMLFKEDDDGRLCRNVVCECAEHWHPDHTQRLENALSKPGSFYYVVGRHPPLDNLSQNVVFIYSPAQKIAARIRFGD